MRRQRLRGFLHDWGWALLVLAGCVTVLVGYIGFSDESIRKHDSEWIDRVYMSVQLFGLEFPDLERSPPFALQVARLVAPLLVAVALIRVLFALWSDLQRRISVALMRKHVVICGLGERGTLLARRFQEEEPSRAIVAIEPDDRAAGVAECRGAGITVIVGDATDESVLRKAGIEKAAHLVAVGGGDDVNAEIAANAAELVAGKRSEPLEAFVHVVDPALANLLAERERAAPRRAGCRLRFFNVYQAGARAWIARHPAFGAEDGPHEHDHLAVVGIGQLGTALVLGAARNRLGAGVGGTGRPRITLVDREANRKREWLLAEFPDFERFFELIACELDITSPQFRGAGFLVDADGRPDVSAVYVCMDDDGRSLTAALTLHERLAEAARVHRLDAAPAVVVRLRRRAGLARLIGTSPGSDTDEPGHGSLRAFTLLDLTCTPAHLLGHTDEERLARAIHDVYLRMQSPNGDTGTANASAVGWDELPEQLKESNRRQAEHARVKLGALGYAYARAGGTGAVPLELSEDEVERLARMEHDRFVAERRFEGWTEGPRDPLAKRSPYLIEWERLPTEIREIDVQFVRALPDAVRAAGLDIYRRAEVRDG